MPICYTTVEYPAELAPILLDSPLLRFDEVRERGMTSVKRYWTNEKFQGLSFTINPRTGKVLMKGSWHKYHNNGHHNHSQYTSADLSADIANLSNQFDYDFSNGLLHSLEAGVNLDLSGLTQPYFTPGYLLPQMITYQGRTPILPMKSIRGAGLGVEFSMHNYRFKVYDKGTQYHLPNPLLRIEYDCKMMKELQPLGIRKFNDLTDQYKMSLLGGKFRQMLSDIVLVEPLKTSSFSTAQRKLYEKAERPSFWKGLNPRERNYHLGRFRELSQTYSIYRLHQTLCENASLEWDALTKNCNNFAVETSGTKSEEENENCNVFSPVNRGNYYNSLPETKSISFSKQIFSFESIQPNPASRTERRCEVTGILLSEKQPVSSKVIGITTLKDNPELIEQLQQRYSRKKRDRENHSEAYYLAHGPRNEKSNPPNNLLRRIQKSQANSQLFPIEEVLRLSSKQQAMLSYFDGTKNEVNLSIKKLIRREELIDSFGQTKYAFTGG